MNPYSFTMSICLSISGYDQIPLVLESSVVIWYEYVNQSRGKSGHVKKLQTFVKYSLMLSRKFILNLIGWNVKHYGTLSTPAGRVSNLHFYVGASVVPMDSCTFGHCKFINNKIP